LNVCKFKERAFKIIHYNVNPPLAPPKRGILGVPSWAGIFWAVLI
jgi:hypothetical protein